MGARLSGNEGRVSTALQRVHPNCVRFPDYYSGEHATGAATGAATVVLNILSQTAKKGLRPTIPEGCPESIKKIIQVWFAPCVFVRCCIQLPLFLGSFLR